MHKLCANLVSSNTYLIVVMYPEWQSNKTLVIQVILGWENKILLLFFKQTSI